MSKMTPGPWEYDGNKDHNGQAIVRSQHIEICTCWHHCVVSIEQEMEANATAIAALPDLIEALEGLLACAAIDEAETNGEWADEELRDATTTARALLARIKEKTDAYNAD